MPTTSDITQTSVAAKRGGTRTKMLASAAEVMRERGASGVTIDAVLARSGAPRGSVYYHFPEGRTQILTEALRYSGDSITATIDAASLPPGLHPLEVHAEDAAGTTLRNSIRLALGPQPLPVFREKDQDNAIGAWPERGLLGTQLGPNKNGRKW